MKYIFTMLFIFTLLTSVFARESHATAILLPQTGQALCYNSAYTVIPCAGTGQDGEFQAGLAWPNPRFTDNGDQSVTDNLTGLMWTKDANLTNTHNPIVDAAGIPVNIGSWQQALDYVKQLNTENYLGHNDWRLPNINELYFAWSKSEFLRRGDPNGSPSLEWRNC
jgi:hypothetical protein